MGYIYVNCYLMTSISNFIITFFGLLLLTHCSTNQDNKVVTQVSLSSIKTQSMNPLTGKWKYENTIWYSSELILQDDGIFKFHDQGCYGQKFSQGQWTNNNGIIQLTSFDTFKQKEQSQANELSESEKKYEHKLKKFPPSLLLGPNDTVRIYLDKVQLQLKSDTLYCVGADKLPEGAKFYRTGNSH